MSNFPWREPKNTKIVSWSYYSGDSIFKGASKREEVNYVVCSCADKCEAYKLGKCASKGVLGGWCPYGDYKTETGYTQRASKWGDLRRTWEKNHADSHIFLKPLDFLCRVGEYHVHIGLPWLEDSFDIFCKARGFEPFEDYRSTASYTTIPIELFTKDLVISLLKYNPNTWFGDSLRKDYEKKLPEWCIRFQKSFPELYEEVVKDYPKIEEYISKIDYKGKKAYLETLLPGQVKVNGTVCVWNGKILTSTADQFGYGILKKDLDKDCTITIYVTEKSTCEIVDNNTVSENTKFID